MRVYLPTTLDQLRQWYADDLLRAPLAGWAVTDSIRAELPDIGDDEAEYAVSTAAAEASQQLLVDDLHKRGRRIVVVVELSYSVVEDDVESPGAVRVLSDLDGGRITAVLADSVDLALTGSADVDDLSWFASQEIPQLLASTHNGVT
jgi:hypothetical protein